MLRDLPISDLMEDRVLGRFRANVRIAAWGCLEWTGAKTKHGYGMVSIKGKTYGAYRVAWVLRHQRHLPEGMAVDHMCCNKLCVNADHLEAVTVGENTRRINRPAPGWEPVPLPVVEACEYNGRRWVDVRWLTERFGKVERHYRAFDDPEAAALFAAHISNLKPSATVMDEAPWDIRARLLKAYTEDAARLWLREPHRKLGGRKPIDLIRAGEVEEVRAVTAWMDDLRRVTA